MKTIPLNNLDIDLYKEKLGNGLEIYIVPKNNVNDIFVTFTTKYGSKTNEFIPNDKEKFIKVPDGVAHFLEHKVFEQKNSIDPFTFFSNNGADSNAYTNSVETTYLFSGPTNFKENINYLLDFVQSPYFTDKNVEKEKGIIAQEITMMKDQPFRVGYEKSIYNSFVKNPIRYSVGGSIESIGKINKEILYECYNTFYNPSNMFIVVTGNVDPKETITIIRENQEKKQLVKQKKIKEKKYKEPNEVYKEKEIINMNVTIPKLFLTYKLNISDIEDKILLNSYFFLYYDILFGPTSVFIEKAKQKKILTEDIGISLIKEDKHLLVMLSVETEKPEEVEELLKRQIMKKKIDKIDFERKKKGILSSYIFMSDNIRSINNKIISNVITHNEIINDVFDRIKNMDYKTMLNEIEKVSFENTTTVIINPK